MGIGSIVLAVLALACMLGGVALTMVPVVGPMLSFASPVLALLGIILGGVARSRAEQGRGSDPLGTFGLVASVLAFVPSLLVAMTCGLCGSLLTGVAFQRLDAGVPPAIFPDAGPPSGSGPVVAADAGPPGLPPIVPPPGSWAPGPPPNAPAPSLPPAAAPVAPAPRPPPAVPTPSAPLPGLPGSRTLPPPPLPPGPSPTASS